MIKSNLEGEKKLILNKIVYEYHHKKTAQKFNFI